MKQATFDEVLRVNVISEYNERIDALLAALPPMIFERGHEHRAALAALASASPVHAEASADLRVR